MLVGIWENFGILKMILAAAFRMDWRRSSWSRLYMSSTLVNSLWIPEQGLFPWTTMRQAPRPFYRLALPRLLKFFQLIQTFSIIPVLIYNHICAISAPFFLSFWSELVLQLFYQGLYHLPLAYTRPNVYIISLLHSNILIQVRALLRIMIASRSSDWTK